MAIEIREVVVKATVSKSGSGGSGEYVTKDEMTKIQDKLMSKILRRVEQMIADERSSR